MKKDIFIKASVGITLGLTLLPFLVLAQLPTDVITNPSQINVLLGKILGWISGIVFIIASIMLLYAAILYLTAGASETIHTKAKSVLIYAIVGIAIAILAYSVQPFIENVLRRSF